MKRRFNYTGRVTIEQSRVHATLVLRPPDPPSFQLTINLEGLELPSHARVFVEAHHKASYARFPWGVVGNLNPPDGRSLSAIDRAEGVLFRVKVVEDVDGKQGKLLALADRLKCATPAESDADRRSLLPVRTADIGELVWKMDFQGDRPTLVLNDRIDDIKGHLRNDGRLQSVVYPEALRQVLSQYAAEAEYELEEVDDEWGARWVNFAGAFVPIPARQAGEDAVCEWVDEVVAAFARAQGSRSRYVQACSLENGQ